MQSEPASYGAKTRATERFPTNWVVAPRNARASGKEMKLVAMILARLDMARGLWLLIQELNDYQETVQNLSFSAPGLDYGHKAVRNLVNGREAL